MNSSAAVASRSKKLSGNVRFGGRLLPYPGGSHAISRNFPDLFSSIFLKEKATWYMADSTEQG